MTIYCLNVENANFKKLDLISGYTVGFKIISKTDENVVLLLSKFKTYIQGLQSVRQI